MFDSLSFVTGFVSFPVLCLMTEMILLTVLIGYDRGLIAFLTLMTTVAAFIWMGWATLDWFMMNWKLLLLIGSAYIPLGIGWVYVKWRSYLGFRYRKAQQHLKEYNALPTLDYPPQVSNHKSDIMRWMGWWPFSFIATVLNDPFRRLYEFLYRNIAESLQAMSDRLFADLKVVKPGADIRQ